MSTRAILPIKSFTEAKQRLAHELSPGPRRALAEAMFSDVLTALRRSKAVDEIVVVSSDHGAQQIAGGHGATVLEDAMSGHSDAAAMAIREAIEASVARVLLVPGDCPLLDPKELDQLLSRPESERMAVIVPDRHRTGTNALVLSPPDVLSPSFGPDSCARHSTMAREAGAPHAVVEVPTLALDIDTADDLEALSAQLDRLHGGAAHTRGMLNQLTRSRL
jgi:2-phospho-L-lactate/phosphoenolpyruvate guanylyltransferase